ncbi:MAG: tetratricopeptide repeat protein [Candidatus Angelobacter sp.]
MARAPSNDIAHEQVTDHWTKKRISNQPPPLANSGSLEPVGGIIADDRDPGIAYAQMAARGNEAAGKRALKLLEQAEHTESGARRDHELHSQLGFLKQMDGQSAAAIEEYQLALQSEPYDYLAGGNLALLKVNQREYPEALQLLKAVSQHNPAQAAPGLNLAILQCGLGDRNSAMATLDRLLDFSPDDQKARAMEHGIRSGSQKCGSR